jgi:hypothetical protein
MRIQNTLVFFPCTIPHFKTLSLFFIKEFASKTVVSLPADIAGEDTTIIIVRALFVHRLMKAGIFGLEGGTVYMRQ